MENKRNGRKKVPASNGVSRRKFLKYGTALGGSVAVSGVRFRTASALDLARKDAAGKVRILGCNPMTSTDGYWDNSTAPVLHMDSGDVVEVETGTHLMGRMVPGADIEDYTLGIHAMIPNACFVGSQYAKKNTLLL